MRVVATGSAWKAFVREPLVHFVAIGVVLFALEAWRRAPGEAAPIPAAPDAAAAPGPRAPIVVDAAARAEIRSRAERRLGRLPTGADLAAETERWIDEEVLYREAIERGLDRNDPMIHERIASRMSFVLEQAAVVPEPDESQLRAWFDEHREQWSAPLRVDFTHVFVAGDDRDRADRLAGALAAGAAPERLGDRFPGGRRYRGRRLADLAQAFGDRFVAGLEDQRPGTWQVRRSRLGWHVVRVDEVEAAQAADFADARLDVRRAWRDAHKEAAVRAALARLRSGWEVVRP